MTARFSSGFYFQLGEDLSCFTTIIETSVRLVWSGRNSFPILSCDVTRTQSQTSIFPILIEETFPAWWRHNFRTDCVTFVVVSSMSTMPSFSRERENYLDPGIQKYSWRRIIEIKINLISFLLWSYLKYSIWSII